MEPRSFRFSSHDLSHQRKQELQQSSSFSFHEFPTVPDQLSSSPETSGLFRFRDVGITDPSFCGSSEMIGFSSGNNLSSSSSSKNGLHRSTTRTHEDSAFPNLMSFPAGDHPPSNWMVNYAGGPFVGEMMSNDARLSFLLRPHMEGYHDQFQFLASSMDSISDLKVMQGSRNDFNGVSPAIDGASFQTGWYGGSGSSMDSSRRNAGRSTEREANVHGLSLSLSYTDSELKTSIDGGVSKPSIISRSERSFHGVVPPSTYVNRGCGPLGPFTGYETILRNSIFMKPAKQLLDEICGVRVEEDGIETESLNLSFRNSNSEGGLNAIVEEAETKRNRTSTSDDGGSSFQRNKTKLVYLHNEVCKMHKQYHHQIQVATSSFEGVAGLGGAAPFVPEALKRVSRGFRCLKHAISDQLNQISDAVGEAFPVTGGGKVDGSSSSVRYVDHLAEKPKPVGGNSGYFGLQQHNIWRPQRGLPERAVAILRAWLFEHFLHPYPTDNDKHMLATQTGLTRNQVSNWFINARVRVWKPMVEEIHLLETKGKTESNQASKNDGNRFGGTSRGEQALYKLGGTNSVLSKLLDQSGLGYHDEEQVSMARWHEGNKTKMVGSSVNFQPSPANGVNVGTVSLTLGLKHGVDYVQHPMEEHEEELIRHQMGEEMVHHVAV